MSSLKAVGVFWDIENCCVPKGKSALKIIERVRERFFQDCREAEFICVCDIIKESDSTIKDLNDGQINVVHINATAKNAADDKIRQSMRRFSDSHPPGTKVVLISSDVNFASDLSDLRHRKKFEVVLVHKAQVSEALLTCATEHFLYEELTKDLPVSAGLKDATDNVCVAYGYDKDAASERVSAILKMLSNNCGGKVISIGPLYAILKFSSTELMERAKKRMNGADVYGRKITVCLPDESPFHLNNKKWSLLSRRRESPSPQRRPKSRSQSFTPEAGERSKSSHDKDADGVGFVLASDVPDRRGFKTPGGPTVEGPVSPNHTHTLPNSNSARYYTKSDVTPSDLQAGCDLLDRLKAGAQGQGQMSLKDIPLPPSGYQFMPPPNMPAPSTVAPSLDSNPIKLFESTSRDSHLVKHLECPSVVFKHPEVAKSRSLSVPGHEEPQGFNSVQHRSQSQNSSAHPWKTHEMKKLPAGFNRRASPVSRPASSGEIRPSPSPDLCPGRPYSPSVKQAFRPRLPSAPSGQLEQTSLPARVRPSQVHKGSNLYRVPTPIEIGEPSSDYTHPDFRADRDTFVELVVSNLDYNISPLDWRKVIYATFQPHVKILSIQVRLQADNTSVATLRLPTEQEARFAIAQYHRRKIGFKRINVQLKPDCSSSPAESLRQDTIALLMEERDNKMALSRLIDLFDIRFHKAVSVSDIYKMRDTIQISESGGGGRWVKLQPGIRRTPTPSQGSEVETVEHLEQSVCQLHCSEGSPGYVDALNCCMLPNVMVLRKHFSPQLHSLLLSHNGYIPLMSFPSCYAAEFSPMQVEKEGGIPLEHVISCVPGVEICVSKVGVKLIQFQQNREPFYDLMKGSAWQELGKISREVMELLRQQATCTMPVSRFIPAYHHYFGKQCRVADYGYTKLQELFEAIPHAIQVLGTGDRKAITLSPRAQLKRFTTDVVKVVKAQLSKQILLDKFPAAYEEVLGKPLFLPHYGICHMEDILTDIPTTTLIVIEEGQHVLLALPRRDQTPEEVERTKKFALEVVDLLKTCPRCCMPFNKFIPAYHHHFGRQCRVADYGFSKLADLFEAVSHVVRMEDEGEERLIQLALPEMRAVLCEQLTSLLRTAGAVPVNKLQQAYASRYNFSLKLSDYGAETTKDLLTQLKNHVKVETYNDTEFATLVKEFEIPKLGLQVMQLLMDESGGCLPIQELCTRYESTFGQRCDLREIRDKLADYIQVEESGRSGNIRLSLQQCLGRNLRLLLLHRPNHRLAMGELYALYRAQYGVDLSPALYGFPSLYQLLLSFPHIVEVRGKPPNKYLLLSNVLPVPGILPPARVDVTSQKQFVTSDTNTAGTPGGSTLLDASKLLDSAIVSQSPPSLPTTADPSSTPAASNRILEMLSASSAALAASRSDSTARPGLASNGVPLAWQMSPGGDKAVCGQSPATPAVSAQDDSTLNSSLTSLQLSSRSQDAEVVGSPSKRKGRPRLAANFKKQ